MGNGLPSLPFFTSDFLIAVATWPTERVGAYCLALFYQWEHGFVPTNDAAELGLVLHTTPTKARRIWQEIASKFIEKEPGKARNMRLEEHRMEVEEKVAKSSNRGRLGARAMWHKRRRSDAQASAQALPEQSLSNANQSQSQSQEEKHIAGAKAPRDARVSSLIRFFDELHRETTGKAAEIDGRKDGSLIKGMLTRRDEPELQALMRAFFVSSDPFIKQAGFTIGVFKSQIGKLIPRLATVKPKESQEIYISPRQAYYDEHGHQGPSGWQAECQQMHRGGCSEAFHHAQKVRAESHRVSA